MLKRVIKSGYKGFCRQKGLGLATIFIMVITIFWIVSLFMFYQVSQFLIEDLEQKADISIYFKEEVVFENISKLQEEIMQMPEVKEVEYVSNEQALTNFMERHKNDHVLIESLGEVGGNPFLASLSIKAQHPSYYESISNFLTDSTFSNDLIEKIDYSQRKTVIERIFSITGAINQFGIISSIFLALLAVLVAFNAIKLAIYNSKEEIQVMKLVGASSRFVRGPFIIQGIIIGALAGLITLVLSTAFFYFIGSKIDILLPGFNLFLYFLQHFFVLLLIQFLAGIALGIGSSLIAIRRYLDV